MLTFGAWRVGGGEGGAGGGFPFIKFPKRNTSFQFYFLPGMTKSTSGKLVRKKGEE